MRRFPRSRAEVFPVRNAAKHAIKCLCTNQKQNVPKCQWKSARKCQSATKDQCTGVNHCQIVLYSPRKNAGQFQNKLPAKCAIKREILAIYFVMCWIIKEWHMVLISNIILASCGYSLQCQCWEPLVLPTCVGHNILSDIGTINQWKLHHYLWWL